MTGVPQDLLETDIVSLLEQMQWKAQLVPNSRRVRGRAATYRIRSEHPPPQCALRVRSGLEMVTMQKSQAAQREKPERNDAQDAPMTWVQVARRTLGPDQQARSHSTCPGSIPQRKSPASVPPASAPAGESQQDHDMDSEEDSTDVEELWNEMQAEEEDSIPLDFLPDYVPPQSSRQLTPKPKKRQRLLQGRQMMTTRPTSSSKLRVQKVEAEVASIKSSLHELLAHMKHGSAPAVAMQGVHRCLIPFGENIDASVIQTGKVAGDGACLWHSLHACIAGFTPGQMQEAGPGHQYKTSMLQLFYDNAQACASVLGTDSAAIQALTAEWQPLQVWADARLIALCASHHHVNVAIFNEADASLEVVTRHHQNLSMSPWWFLRYTGDHYEPAVLHNRAKLQGALSQARFLPWHPRQNTGVGGASFPSTERAEQSIVLSTWNIGGWKRNVHHVANKYREDRNRVMLLQETHLTSDGQKSATLQAGDLGCDACWGTAAPIGRCKDGTLRTQWGQCPGVGIIAPKDLGMCKRLPVTVRGKFWSSAGRLVMAQLLTFGLPLLLICVYAPSGHEREQERRTFFSDVVGELAAQCTYRFVVGGDYNANPVDTELAGSLIEQGSGIPRWVHRDGSSQPPTYHSGDVSGLLDGFIIGPDTYATPCQTADPMHGCPHSCVSIGVSCGTAEKFPRVHPTVNLKPCQSDRSGLDWQQVHGQVEHVLRELESVDNSSSLCVQVQDIVDRAWEICLTQYRLMVLQQCAVTNARGDVQDERRLGACSMPPCRRMQNDSSGQSHVQYKQHVMRDDTHERMQRHLHRLIELQNNPGCTKATYRLQRDQAFVCRFLRIDPQTFQDQLRLPSQAIPVWIQGIRRHVELTQKQQVTHWKSTLTTSGKPHPRLYRWIKGYCPPPGLVVQDKEGSHTGPRACFGALRCFWGGIMGANQHTQQDLCRWGEDHPYQGEGMPLTVNQVLQAAKAMRAQSVGGLDGWPVAALRCLTPEVVRTVLVLWQATARTMCWPSAMLYIRTQLIPKSHDSVAVEDLRPISIMSVWYRLWGRCVLESHSGLLASFDTSLRGGIPTRGLSDTVLHWALEVESALHSIPLAGTQEPTPVYVLSIDAVKCFDRIQQCQVLSWVLTRTPSGCSVVSTVGFRESCLTLVTLINIAITLEWASPKDAR